MKRIICFIFFIAVLFNTAAFATEPDFMDKQYNSFEKSISMSFELQKPLRFFEHLDIPKGLDEFVDISGFFSSLEETEMTALVKFELDQENKRLKFSAESEMELPVTINDNYRIVSNTKNGVWLDVELSDRSNPKIMLVLKSPFLKKHLSVDIVDWTLDEYGEESLERTLDFFEIIMDKETSEIINRAAKNSLIKNAVIEKQERTYTIIMDGNSTSKFLSDIYTAMMPLLKGILPDEDINEDAFYQAVEETGFDKIQDDFKLIMIYTLDEEDNISTVNVTYEIDTNIYDEMVDEISEKEEKAPIEDFDISFKIGFMCEYKNMNEPQEITMPVLNEENSITLGELLDDPYEDDYNYDVTKEKYYFYFEVSNFVRSDDGTAMFPLREILKGFSIDDHTAVTYSNDVITISGKTTGPGRWFDTSEITVGYNELFKDGEMLWLDHAPVVVDDVTYVDASFVLNLFDANINNASKPYDSGKIMVSFSKNYNYEPPMEYKRIWYDIYTGEAIVLEDGTYAPSLDSVLYTFELPFDCIEPYGETKILGGSWFEEAYGIKAGENKFYIDGIEYTLEHPVIESGGRIYVDTSFIEQMFGAEYYKGQYNVLYDYYNFSFKVIEK